MPAWRPPEGSPRRALDGCSGGSRSGRRPDLHSRGVPVRRLIWAARIGPTQDHIYELAAETGVATFPQWTGGGTSCSRMATATVRGEEDYDADDLAEDSIRRSDRGGGRDPARAPGGAASALARRDDVRHRINEQLQRPVRAPCSRLRWPTYSRPSRPTCRCRHVLYIRSGGGWESLTGTEGGAQQDRLVAAFRSLRPGLPPASETLVRLGWPARAVSHDAAGVAVAGEAGEVLRPPSDHRHSVGARRASGLRPTASRWPRSADPAASRRIGRYLDLVYPTPWWRELGLRGFTTHRMKWPR